MARNEQVFQMAQDWVKWLDTRRFYCKPEQQNILAQFMARNASKGEPNADNSPALTAFNLAVTDLPKELFLPFVVVYCEIRPDNKPIKWLSHELGITPSNYYGRAHKAADQVQRITRSLVDLSMQMRRELGYD